MTKEACRRSWRRLLCLAAGGLAVVHLTATPAEAKTAKSSLQTKAGAQIWFQPSGTCQQL